MPLLPSSISKYFWGDNPKELSFTKHPKYISNTILDKGDVSAIRWLFKKQTKKQLKKNLNPRMSKKSRNFWQIYFS